MASSGPMATNYLNLLDERLRRRSPMINLWEDYYEGKHHLVFATSRFRETFGNLFREFADNWCELIVNASVERLKIIGFQANDKASEKSAAEIWDDNDMAIQAKIAHTEAVKLGTSYILVDQNVTVPGTDTPLITIEHPAQCIVAKDPANRRLRRAALKEWVNDDGYVYANVYLPDGIYRYQTDQKVDEQQPSLQVSGMLWPEDYVAAPATFLHGGKATWIPRHDETGFYIPNKLSVVPVIPLENNPTLAVGGRSDIAHVIPIQNAVNKFLMDMIIASEFASFNQRWATGIEIPRDPETGKPLNEQRFLAAVSRVWAVEDEGAKFGQFAASDLSNYVKALELVIQHIAAITRTPPHYLLGQSGAFPSGDSLTATETGLVAKCESKTEDFSPSHAEAVSLAHELKTKERKRFKPTWKDCERRIQAQRIDGALKMSTLGVPQDACWAETGATPDEIERWHEMKTEMDLPKYTTLFAPLPTAEEGAAPLKPIQEGTDGNKDQEGQASTVARVTRIHD